MHTVVESYHPSIPGVTVVDKLDPLNPTVKAFAPERWGEVERFAKLYGRTFADFSKTEGRAVSGLIRHFHK